MNALNRRRRGAAAVELAVSMIFLVPLIMYMIFLQEMLIMKLNGQEAAVQASWDFTVLDYGSKVEADGIARFSRLTYCDHSAAYDSYDRDYDCQDVVHHKAMTAHECWIGKDAAAYGGQVRCSLSEQLSPSGAAAQAVANFGQGGVVTCSSRLGIMNYYLPNSFLNNFRGGKGFAVNEDASGTKKDRQKSRWAGTGGSVDLTGGQAPSQDQAHDDRMNAKENGETSLGSNYWRLAKTEHAMLVDPWALGLEGGKNDIPNINPNVPSAFNNNNPLYARISAAYKTQSSATDKAEDWNKAIENQKMISGSSRQDGQGDNLTTAAAAFEGKSNTQEFGDHWAAQWGDNRVQQTYNNRQNGYFGLQQ
ncbi:MAG: hypothetical protein GQE15_19475 [Archangiaceae bacterium]|nr:hypothetical protein [Archangiaceae bacterium]